MTDQDDLVMNRETLKIEGDRNLYVYTFDSVEDGKTEPGEE